MKKFNFTIRGNKYSVEVKSFEDHIAELEVNGTPFTVEMEKELKVTKTPKLVRPEKISTGEERKPLTVTPGLSRILSPLPGIVIKINFKEGEQVKKGEVLLLLEAMKMENNILAEKAGKIQSLKVKEGDSVLQGDVLVEIQ